MLKGKNCCHLDREFYNLILLALLIELPYIQVLFSYVYFFGKRYSIYNYLTHGVVDKGVQ